LSACTQGGGERAPGAPILLSVVRSHLWGLGGEDDLWQVEVPATATIAQLKETIEQLYELPKEAQRLSLGETPESPALEDSAKVETVGRRVYLLPSENGGLAGLEDFGDDPMMAGMAEALMGAAQENMEVTAALEESLRGVMYKVTFKRPAEAGGAAAGREVKLELEALTLVGDAQQIVEVELFGGVDKEPAYLTFEGMPLPPHVALYQAGIEDGKTVVVSKERPPEAVPEELLAAMLGGGGAPGFGP